MTIAVTVLFFAAARDLAGGAESRIDMQAHSTLRDIVKRLEVDHPRLAPLLRNCRFAVNAGYADMDARLRDGDEVAVIPPVSGGAGVHAEIVRRPIDMADLAKRVVSPAGGAALTFAGTVREDADADRRVVRIEYEGYEPMARDVLRRIADAAAEAHHVSVAVEHRLGVLAIGEISIGIAVASPHRADGFSALRAVIEAVKKDLPIWKKEQFSDGSSEWVNGH